MWLCQEPVVLFFVWAHLMSSLSSWLELVHTATDITEWHSLNPLSPAHTYLPGLLQAIEAQDRMGFGCSLKPALPLNGPVFRKLITFGLVVTIPGNDRLPLSSLVLNSGKLHGISGIIKTNQI